MMLDSKIRDHQRRNSRSAHETSVESLLWATFVWANGFRAKLVILPIRTYRLAMAPDKGPMNEIERSEA